MRLVVFLGLFSYSAAIFFGTKQAVAVQGRLLCKGAPAVGVKVKLYDEGILHDNKMAQGVTNSNGEFYLTGTKREFTTIDPKLNIYHNCDRFALCARKFGIEIPKSHINNGDKAKKVYDIGTINLQNKFIGEKIDCIN